VLPRTIRRRIERYTSARQRRDLAALLGDERITLLDVGARGGAPLRWQRVAPHVDLITVDSDDASTLKSDFASVYSVDAILLDRRDDVAFHRTRNPKLSSVFKPSRALLSLFERPERADVVDTRILQTRTIDDLVESGLRRPTVVKLDTQGSELLILRGADATLQHVYAIEIEVEFRRLYEGQPLFGDVEQYLGTLGFSLVDWTSTARWQRGTSGGLRSGLGELIGADALFLRLPEDLQLGHLAANELRRYLAVLYVYGRFELIRHVLPQPSGRNLGASTIHDVELRCDDLERRLRRSRRLISSVNALGTLQQHPVTGHLEY
jgi:FkbM family methyltransferase